MKACKFCSTKTEDNVSRCPSCGSNVFLHVCENCGNLFDSGYCPNCGVKAGQKKKICPDCHTSYYSNACPNCGYMPSRKQAPQEIVHKHVYVAPETPKYSAPTPTQARRARKKGKGCGCLTWILLICILLGLLYGRPSSKKTSSTSTGRSSATATATRKPGETAAPTATPEPAVAAAQVKVDKYFASSPEEAKEVRNQLTGLKKLDAAEAGKVLVVSRDWSGDRGALNSGSVPDYISVLGYAAVSKDQKLDDNTDFEKTPWEIPVYRKDKQFWEEDGTIGHKTEVVVIAQELEEPKRKYSTSKCTGYLHVIRMDTGKDCWLDVKNFVVQPYWEDPLTEAWEKGFCIAVFNQKSDYYPVTGQNAKVEIEDGTKVLVPMKSTYYSSSPDKTNNPMPAYVFREWKYGYGGVDVFFNTEDLTLVY